MNVYRVAFIGHRKIDEREYLVASVDGLIKGLLQSKDYVEFYIGGNGDFFQRGAVFKRESTDLRDLTVYRDILKRDTVLQQSAGNRSRGGGQGQGSE